MGGALTVRSPLLLAIALAMLASSGALALLVHDGEMGTDEADAMVASPGTPLRLKGQLAAVVDAPEDVRDRLGNHTVALEHDGLDLHILVTADTRLPDEGTWVVQGTLLQRVLSDGGGTLVLQAHEVTAPFLFG